MDEKEEDQPSKTPFAAVMPHCSLQKSVLQGRASQQLFEREGSIEDLTYDQLLQLQYLPHKPIIKQPVCKYRVLDLHTPNSEKRFQNEKVYNNHSEQEDSRKSYHKPQNAMCGGKRELHEDLSDDDIPEFINGVFYQSVISDSGSSNNLNDKEPTPVCEAKKPINAVNLQDTLTRQPIPSTYHNLQMNMQPTPLIEEGAKAVIEALNAAYKDDENLETNLEYKDDFESSSTNAESG